jgi:twitching motility protein PilT
MYSAIQTGAGHGMITLDQSLKELVAKHVITRETAREKAKIPENF